MVDVKIITGAAAPPRTDAEPLVNLSRYPRRNSYEAAQPPVKLYGSGRSSWFDAPPIRLPQPTRNSAESRPIMGAKEFAEALKKGRL
jgi:hypothetical protein